MAAAVPLIGRQTSKMSGWDTAWWEFTARLISSESCCMFDTGWPFTCRMWSPTCQPHCAATGLLMLDTQQFCMIRPSLPSSMSLGTEMRAWLPGPCEGKSGAVEVCEEKELGGELCNPAVLGGAIAEASAGAEAGVAGGAEAPTGGRLRCSSGCSSQRRPMDSRWLPPPEAGAEKAEGEKPPRSCPKIGAEPGPRTPGPKLQEVRLAMGSEEVSGPLKQGPL